MAGSVFGTIFKISTWGESHGKGIGVVVDGCPAGLALCEDDIQVYLNRRKPGQSKFSTPRKEDDAVEILSGVFEGKTTGTPISMVVYNKTQRSGDYGEIARCYRPGHADYTFDEKYGFRDYRGGGRSSGRETIARVAAGAIAAKLLYQMGIEVYAYTESIGDVKIDAARFDDKEARDTNPLNMPDATAAEEAAKLVAEQMANYDSVGGVIACSVTGLPTGIGEPVFEKLDANLSKAIFSIGAVKGVEIGDGFSAATAFGSANNDAFAMKNGKVTKLTNHAGGILGGISDGSDLFLRAAIKPTPSIFSEQQTVSREHEDMMLQIKGRHDPIIVPRAVVVVEAMTAIVLLDMLLVGMSARADRVIEFYTKK
ncbi:MAG: chorismate synthase [Lachnospiraceae bacterium]|nr:chorismate synthase [Lachnospiraceae bacterium]